MRQSFIVLIGLCAIGCLGGCVSSETQSDPSVIDSVVIKERNSINAVFSNICRLMLNGEIKTVYDKYLSKKPRELQGYEEFANEYEANRKSWQELFNGAMLKHIAPVDKIASAVVLWGNGDSSLMEFSKEDGVWKINYLRGPAGVVDQGTRAQ
ncbi:MAG TPA: hypothetical protein VJC37_03415 [Planctomycetota bacterium]|nr:hypothetical protein [Planctomycetota bacterium]